MQMRLIRLIDIVAALSALILLSPVFVVLACLIYTKMGKPIVFAQKRLGLNGQAFIVYKFRSMLNVELDENHDLETVNEYAVKIKNDPRITPIGAFIRKTSLDELPQILNVLKGDMSLVGPRPWVPEEYDAIPKDWHSRLGARPGITGLAQINGRSDLAMEQIVSNDMEWVDKQSIGHYFSILCKTFTYALKMKNVY